MATRYSTSQFDYGITIEGAICILLVATMCVDCSCVTMSASAIVRQYSMLMDADRDLVAALYLLSCAPLGPISCSPDVLMSMLNWTVPMQIVATRT